MVTPNNSNFTPKIICFGIEFLGLGMLALFMFYPALLALFFGGRSLDNVSGASAWSWPALTLALLMSGWFMFALLALLRP